MHASVKHKGIDGGPHKRWSMWFNSTQREEPYQLLTWVLWLTEMLAFTSGGYHTGAAWLSSARVVRCWVKSRNERNPRFQLPPARGPSGETAGASCEEGGDDVKSARPLRPGRHTCYNGGYRGPPPGDRAPIHQNPSQFGLESATRLHEAGFASNRASAMAR